MRWLSSKISGNYRSSWLKQILFFSILLCFLSAFNLSRAQANPPDSTEFEHPWDDLCLSVIQPGPSHPPPSINLCIFKFGPGAWIIIQPVVRWGQKDGLGKGKVSGPVEKNRSHLFILFR